MIDSLDIGKILNNFLQQDAELKKLIGNKIYPIVADQGTTYPFICYKRTGLNLQSSKDRYNYRQTAYVTFIVASKSYKESISIAKAVKQCLNLKRGSYDGLQINQITLTDASEEYITDSDAFVQYLNFSIDLL